MDQYKRYETHHKKTLTLHVTRQNQQFKVSEDMVLCDIELVRSSVELVGEPGWAGTGQIGYGHTHGAYDSAGASVDLINPTYMGTMNTLYVLNTTGTSTVLGSTQPNAVVHKSTLNHGWVDVSLKGMTENRNFMRDDNKQDNQLAIILPTDSGVLATRTAQQLGPPHPLILENIQLEPTVTVDTMFIGTGPAAQRRARFVEDYADTAAALRSADGSVKYFTGVAPGPCQIPSNMISSMVLQFNVTPRSTL